MNDLKIREAIRWVIDRNGQLVYQDNGQVLVELQGIVGVGPCPARALKEWRRRKSWKKDME